MSATVLYAMRFVSKISTSLFAGNAIYVGLVEHKARMECGTRIAALQFAPSYRRAALLQVSLASIGFLGAVSSYYLDRDVKWLISGLLIVSVIPYTFMFMMPINRILLDPNNDTDSDNTKVLLDKWGRFHSVRSALSFVAMIIMNLSC